MSPRPLPQLLLATVAALTFVAACADDDDGDGEAAPDTTEAQGVTGPPVEELDGRELFVQVCSACHQEDGTGIEGVFPPLADSAFVSIDDPRVVAETVLHGRGGMPAFGPALSDTEIAAILTYLRTELNDADPVDPETVAAARERDALDEDPRDEQEDDAGEEDDGGQALQG